MNYTTSISTTFNAGINPVSTIFSSYEKCFSGATLYKFNAKELDASTIDLNKLNRAFSSFEGTALHELIGHTYDAYQGDFPEPQGSEFDSGIKQENDYNRKTGVPERSGTDH